MKKKSSSKKRKIVLVSDSDVGKYSQLMESSAINEMMDKEDINDENILTMNMVKHNQDQNQLNQEPFYPLALLRNQKEKAKEKEKANWEYKGEKSQQPDNVEGKEGNKISEEEGGWDHHHYGPNGNDSTTSQPSSFCQSFQQQCEEKVDQPFDPSKRIRLKQGVGAAMYNLGLDKLKGQGQGQAHQQKHFQYDDQEEQDDQQIPVVIQSMKEREKQKKKLKEKQRRQKQKQRKVKSAKAAEKKRKKAQLKNSTNTSAVQAVQNSRNTRNSRNIKQATPLSIIHAVSSNIQQQSNQQQSKKSHHNQTNKMLFKAKMAKFNLNSITKNVNNKSFQQQPNQLKVISHKKSTTIKATKKPATVTAVAAVATNQKKQKKYYIHPNKSAQLLQPPLQSRFDRQPSPHSKKIVKIENNNSLQSLKYSPDILLRSPMKAAARLNMSGQSFIPFKKEVEHINVYKIRKQPQTLFFRNNTTNLPFRFAEYI